MAFKIFIIKGFRTIVFILIVIYSTFRLIYPPAFFRCLLNSGTYTELRTTFFIEFTWWGASSDSVSHKRVQALSILVLILACSQDWTRNLQMIVSLEVWGTDAYNRYTVSCWGFNKMRSSKSCVGYRVRQTFSPNFSGIEVCSLICFASILF